MSLQSFHGCKGNFTFFYKKEVYCIYVYQFEKIHETFRLRVFDPGKQLD